MSVQYFFFFFLTRAASVSLIRDPVFNRKKKSLWHKGLAVLL